MSYRIEVAPEATLLLRTLPGHAVLQVGRTLADLAEVFGAGTPPLSLAARDGEVRLVEAGECAVLVRVDHGGQTLRVEHVERTVRVEHPKAAPAPGASRSAAAP